MATFFTLEGAFLGFLGEAGALRFATAAAAVTLRLPPAALAPAAFLALAATAFFLVGFAAGAGRFFPAFSPLFSGFPAVAGSLNEPDAPLPSNTQTHTRERLVANHINKTTTKKKSKFLKYMYITEEKQ